MFFNKDKNIGEDILKKITERDRVERYTYLVIGCFLLAFSFNVFYKPNDLVTGGISGISIVLEKVLGIP